MTAQSCGMILDVVDERDVLTRYAVSINSVSQRHLEVFGKGGMPVCITGIVSVENGQQVITPSRIQVIPRQIEPARRK